MESLEQLVRRAKAGETAAFEEIVGRLSRRAVATAHLITGDLHTGEEAAQDAFVVAWRRIGDVRDPERFLGWFSTILARLASRRRRPPAIPIEPGREPAAPAVRSREEDLLPSVVTALRPKYRQVLALRYVDGLSYREIAAALGITVARVKSRLHDGRELVRERIRARDRKRT